MSWSGMKSMMMVVVGGRNYQTRQTRGIVKERVSGHVTYEGPYWTKFKTLF
jgi:hypothetical protein